MMKAGQFFGTTVPKYVIENNGKFLTYTSALTFTVSGLGQGLSVLNNKKLPKDDKKYIFYQEMGTMGLNLAALLAFSLKFGKWGENWAKSGNFLPNGVKSSQVKEYIKKLGQSGAEMTKVDSKIATHIKATGVAATLLGQIVALNVVAPLVRNVLAGCVDKYCKHCKKDGKDKFIPSPVLPASPIRNEQVPVTMFTSSLHSTKASDMFNIFADNPHKNVKELLNHDKTN